MSLLDIVHGSYIHTRRVRVLSGMLEKLLPANCSVLDVGCGDGLLAEGVAKKRKDLSVYGVDVLVRPSVAIPVRKFDGLHIPWEDKSVDVAMFIDVLHHCDDFFRLLGDAARVSRRAILIKDHFLAGAFAYNRLSLMDKIGNARHGVALPCNYFKKAEWINIFEQLHLSIAYMSSDFNLYPPPLEWIFGGDLQFITLLQIEV